MQTIGEFDQEFGTDEQCKQFLAKMRWPNGVTCPRCGNEKVYVLAARPFNWLCKSGKESINTLTGEVVTCHKRNGYRFSVISGTIFQDTKIAMSLWFKVGYLMLTSKKGMSRHVRREFHARLSHKLVHVYALARCDGWRYVSSTER
jgi:hypothetical protein